MKKTGLILFPLFLVLMTTTLALSQQNDSGIKSVMRSEGKIYVLVAVMLTILIGVFLYLFRLDRKIKKLEDAKKNKHRN
ncbi:MAG: CcmD family protein [Chitinophagaceae bacterium]|nr:CcmD family protein [Chitinophagaceae bacterium]